jgi:S-(hydroxymethyl)glutathione dehydrogenase/alcohol dehydrogenase
LSIERIELDEPGEHEVLIRMAAAGVCGSDRHYNTGYRTMRLPVVPGHEGAGVVEAVGPGVRGVSVGDHVVQTFVAPCGQCYRCRRRKFTYCEVGLGAASDGKMMDGSFRFRSAEGWIGTGMRLGSFSQYTVSPETACVVIPRDIDLTPASLVSCGVSTGVGAALNVAEVTPGDSVAVFGIGGVGAAAIAGAVIAGAAAVIAVDILDGKLEMARSFGATHTVNAREHDVVAAVREATGGYGVDKAILCIDIVRPEHLAAAIDCLDAGGTAVIVGGAASGLDNIPTSPALLMRDSKRVLGTMYGGMDPHRDVLRYLELYRAGRLPLDRFVTSTYELDAINICFDDLIAGRNVRGVVVF